MIPKEEACNYLDRFYQTHIRSRIKEPKIDAEWSWFVNRLKDPTTKPYQLEQYLDGLERNKKFSEMLLKPVGLSPSNNNKLESRLNILDPSQNPPTYSNSNIKNLQKVVTHRD